ncbi:Predicted PurR-regulated permease PerM [Salegentibacter echinorum]|uniref:Predicted PurR-regulated permease PerM n=1 Tax=Salegentibacter echinorum TaxID=1073325 RepID=A0A1M5G8S3_SALEC|nr:AI-2E family transporter [Salegentibacter echinorum]SHG00088.1 Predicted PurR-regulated permease PerM [Salegentibacter echinorum]
MTNSKINISGEYVIKFLGIISLVWVILTYASALILPILVSVIIATLLDKPTKMMKKWKFPSWLAISISILITAIIFILLFWLISSQVNNIANDWSVIREKAMEKFELFSSWMQSNFQVNPRKVFNKNVDFFNQLRTLAQGFLSSVTNIFTSSLLVLIYTILFLMQKDFFIRFFKKLVKNNSGAANILKDSAQIISGYLLGKVKIMFFLFVIYFIGFKVGQVPYALFLALFAALFSIIPYVGNIIGGGVAVILSYLYAGATPALIVVAVISATQLIENYILTPWIIGDEIDLNPFITVFGVILFSSLWGIVGAIIALPIVGVLKVVFQHTEGLEAYAYLLKKPKK